MNLLEMRKRLILVLLALGVLIGGVVTLMPCGPFPTHNFNQKAPKDLGPGYNSTRIKIGVPIIEPDWSIRDQDSTYAYWTFKGGRVDRIEPYHLFKGVYLSNRGITREEDAFHFETKSDTAYRLVISSYYSPSASKLDSLHVRLIEYPKNEPTSLVSNDVPLSTLDSIFIAWNLQPIRH